MHNIQINNVSTFMYNNSNLFDDRIELKYFHYFVVLLNLHNLLHILTMS